MTHSAMGKSAWLGAVAAMLLAAFPAAGAEVTRDSYREAAEPICKANTEANERILSGVRGLVQQGELKPASVRFAKAAKALRGTIVELKAVPRPPADRARLSKWLGFVTSQASYLERAARQLKAGNKAGTQRTVLLLTNNASRANNVVVPFEFRYCRFEPSRFT